jgi:hypothetical protein
VQQRQGFGCLGSGQIAAAAVAAAAELRRRLEIFGLGFGS